MIQYSGLVANCLLCFVTNGYQLLSDAFPCMFQVEQIKRASNMWTNDSLFLREFLLIPIDVHAAKDLIQTRFTNGGTPQPSTSTDISSNCGLEIVTRQDLLHHAGRPASGKVCESMEDKHKQSVDSVDFKDFLSKMDTSLAEIKDKVKHLDQSSQ